MNEKTLCFSITFHVSNVSAESDHKSGTTLLSRGMIPLNELFNKQKNFGKSTVDEMFKMASILRPRNMYTDNFGISRYLSAHY